MYIGPNVYIKYSNNFTGILLQELFDEVHLKIDFILNRMHKMESTFEDMFEITNQSKHT